MPRLIVSFFIVLVACPILAVDLKDEQYEAINKISDEKKAVSTGSKPWHERLQISGFVNAGYVHTGVANSQGKGHFFVAERRFGTELFLDAHVWKNMGAFVELMLRAGAITPVEVYIYFRNILEHVSDDLLNIKVGKINIPFGEEYLWQSSKDNPLILRTVAWPWGVDEGVVVFGRYRWVGWVASIHDGAMSSTTDDTGDKMVVGKIYATPVDPVYLSASFMHAGLATVSSFWLDEVPIVPVGTTTAPGGASTSTRVDFDAWELAAKIDLFGQGYVRGNYGQAKVKDVSPFDRRLEYFYVEPLWNVTNKFYVVGRFSSIRVMEDGRGYLLGGDYNGAYALTSGVPAKSLFDTRRITRFSGGVGYKINPSVVMKLEFARDKVSFISTATTPVAAQDDRWFGGIEIVASF